MIAVVFCAMPMICRNKQGDQWRINVREPHHFECHKTHCPWPPARTCRHKIRAEQVGLKCFRMLNSAPKILLSTRCPGGSWMRGVGAIVNFNKVSVGWLGLVSPFQPFSHHTHIVGRTQINAVDIPWKRAAWQHGSIAGVCARSHPIAPGYGQ